VPVDAPADGAFPTSPSGSVDYCGTSAAEPRLEEGRWSTWRGIERVLESLVGIGHCHVLRVGRSKLGQYIYIAGVLLRKGARVFSFRRQSWGSHSTH